jgi:hypothetical protein
MKLSAPRKAHILAGTGAAGSLSSLAIERRLRLLLSVFRSLSLSFRSFVALATAPSRQVRSVRSFVDRFASKHRSARFQGSTRSFKSSDPSAARSSRSLSIFQALLKLRHRFRAGKFELRPRFFVSRFEKRPSFARVRPFVQPRCSFDREPSFGDSSITRPSFFGRSSRLRLTPRRIRTSASSDRPNPLQESASKASRLSSARPSPV